MALPDTGEISLLDIASEFGGTTPHALSEYYGAGGAPGSAPLSISDFYGLSNVGYAEGYTWPPWAGVVAGTGGGTATYNSNTATSMIWNSRTGSNAGIWHVSYALTLLNNFQPQSGKTYRITGEMGVTGQVGFAQYWRYHYFNVGLRNSQSISTSLTDSQRTSLYGNTSEGAEVAYGGRYMISLVWVPFTFDFNCTRNNFWFQIGHIIVFRERFTTLNGHIRNLSVVEL